MAPTWKSFIDWTSNVLENTIVSKTENKNNDLVLSLNGSEKKIILKTEDKNNELVIHFYSHVYSRDFLLGSDGE